MTNAKFDMHMVANHGIEIKGHIFDTVAMDWLHDENRQGRHGLKQCAADYLGLKMAPFTQVFGSVGTTDKEVETLCRMHDALETKDPSLALELLALVGQIEMDPGALEDMQLVSKRLAVGRSFPLKLLTASQVLKIGRKYGLCPTTRGKAGYVSDFSELMGLGPVDKDDRDSVTKVLGDSDVLIEAHEILLHYLSSLSQNDRPPLDMIQLMVGDYASLDAWASFMLVAALEEKLSEEFIQPGVSILDYYNSTTATLVRILWMLERRGFQLDVDEIEKLATPMANDISRLEREFVSLAGWSVNPNSPTQLVDLFFEKRGNQWVDPFGAPPWKMSSGGTTGQKKPSISKEVIDDWAEKGDPRAKCLQEHRVLQKLHSTYIDALPKTVDWRKRIHTDLKIAGTVTGRLSSGDPNLQNIPARGDWGTGYRLPTEAEWEKAARGGVNGWLYPWAGSDEIQTALLNYRSSGFEKTTPVGSYPSNGYGLFDMAGNVTEWCWDMGANSYPPGSAVDPRGPTEGSSFRHVRGGSWADREGEQQVANKQMCLPDTRKPYLGFRTVLSQGQP